MKKRLLILNWILCILYSPVQAQELKLLLDTFVEADLVQLDPLGNIYLINQSDKTLQKFNPEFVHLFSISIQNNWENARLDVSDPFKIILYYPGDYKIQLLDAQLSLLQTINAPDLNEKAAIGHYDSDRFIIYDGNNLAIQNYKTGKTENSTFSGLFSSMDAKDVSLKKLKNYIYFIQKKLSIVVYTNQLFEAKKWTDSDMEMADVNEHFIFKLKNNTIFGFNQINYTETELYTAKNIISAFAISNQKMLILEGNRLKLWYLY
ncbi:MAG: hypothetical protein IPM92_09575 [Saprospiraceae bacterium]|nr:hypothetical protein [Saprospiraceae bacterium]